MLTQAIKRSIYTLHRFAAAKETYKNKVLVNSSITAGYILYDKKNTAFGIRI